MGDFMGVVGFLGLLVGIVMIIAYAVKKNPLKIPGIVLGASFLVFIVGVAISPTPIDDASDDSIIDQELADETIDIDTEEEKDTEAPDDKESTDTPTIPASTTAPSGQLKVHFIDVGQGDAILIQTPTMNVLIDGGDRGTTVVNYLKNQGVTKLDLVIGTHPHADHIGGLINVMQSIPVTEVIDPGVVHTTKTFEDYLNIIDQKNIKFTEGRAGMTRDLGGGASMQIIHPSSPSSSHLNNASIVARVTFGQISFMFTGDAESAAESQILNRGYTLKSTILKVGHHGSKTSTSNAFLNAVDPDAGIIMVGKVNQYGHPHEETLAKLNNGGVKIFRTDTQGTIIITTDGKTYSVNKQPFSYQQQQQPPPSSQTPTPTQPDPTPDPTPPPTPSEKVNINTASFEDLQLIIHIGPTRAQEIIDKRPFSSVDDLSRVSGIGPSRLKDIKEQGIAYVP